MLVVRFFTLALELLEVQVTYLALKSAEGSWPDALLRRLYIHMGVWESTCILLTLRC